MFVGVGAARVRRLFHEARRLAPCVVFIDEVDALGRARGGAADASSAEHDRTLNQLLVEMDGFDPTSGIVVIATTNRPDMLDPALVRPGRFDRQIHVPLPTMIERRAILGVHAAKIVLSEEVSLDQLARTTTGLSGAQLANLLNEAALLAARTHATAVDNAHIAEARDRLLMGEERTTLVLDEHERYATAVHEAGHVVCAMTAVECDPVHKVSILPRGRALGVTQSLPDRDRVMYTKELLEDRICMLLGGRAAEIEVLGTMTAGAADDLERASELARKMAGELGMSDLGCLHVGRDAPRSERKRVERAARGILEAQLTRARHMICARREGLDALAKALVERDLLDADEVEALVPKRSIPMVAAA
jgi:cell division protease FtsH